MSWVPRSLTRPGLGRHRSVPTKISRQAPAQTSTLGSERLDSLNIVSSQMSMRYSIPIESLKAVINPLDGTMWQVDPIDPNEVKDAAERGEVCDRPWAEVQAAQLPRDLHRTYHVRRLAWLLNAAPCVKDEHKIMLCVSADRIWFYDGNHRIAAAIVRGDTLIDLSIASSDEIDLAALFKGIKKIDP